MVRLVRVRINRIIYNGWIMDITEYYCITNLGSEPQGPSPSVLAVS